MRAEAAKAADADLPPVPRTGVGDVPMFAHSGEGLVSIKIDRVPYVPVWLDDQGPFTFLLDTGCIGCCTSAEVAREIGWAGPAPGHMPVGCLAIGGFRCPNFTIGISDTTTEATRIVGRRVDGYLGNMLFAHLSATIDYPNQTLEVRERRSTPDTQCTRIPVDISNGYTIAPVRMNDSGPFSFLLDTGGYACYVNPAVADALDLPHGESGVTSVGPLELPYYRSQARAFGIGEVVRDDVPLVVLDSSRLNEQMGRPIDGILGYEFLRHYRLTLDYECGRIKLD